MSQKSLAGWGQVAVVQEVSEVLTCRRALDQSPGGTCAHWEEMVLAGRPQVPRPEVHGVLQEWREMGEGKRGCLGGMG